MVKRIVSVLLSLAVIISFMLFIKSVLTINSSLQELEQNNLATQQQKRIILIAQELDTPYWKLLEQGARHQAEQYQYLLQYVGPIRYNAQEQQRLLQKAIASQPQGIIVQGLDIHEDLIAEAQHKNIPVITVDIDAPNSSRIAYVGTDNNAAGVQLAQLVMQRIGLEAKVGIIIGSEEAENQLTRLQAFQAALTTSPLVQIVDKRSSNISRLQAGKMTVEMLEQQPDINVIVGLSGLDAVGIVDGLDALQRDNVLVFGFDNLSNTEVFIEQGRIAGSIVQQPYIIGKQAIETLYSYYNGYPYEEQIFIPTTVLSSSLSEDTP